MNSPQPSNFWLIVVTIVVTLLLLPYLGIRILGSDSGVEQDRITPSSRDGINARQPASTPVEESPHEDIW